MRSYRRPQCLRRRPSKSYPPRLRHYLVHRYWLPKSKWYPMPLIYIQDNGRMQEEDNRWSFQHLLAPSAHNPTIFKFQTLLDQCCRNSSNIVKICMPYHERSHCNAFYLDSRLSWVQNQERNRDVFETPWTTLYFPLVYGYTWQNMDYIYAKQ